MKSKSAKVTPPKTPANRKKRSLPRQGLEHHTWPIVTRLLSLTDLGFPVQIKAVADPHLRSEVETAFARELAETLRLVLTGSKTTDDRVEVIARQYIGEHPRLIPFVEAVEHCSAIKSETKIRLGDLIPRLHRLELLLGPKGRSDEEKLGALESDGWCIFPAPKLLTPEYKTTYSELLRHLDEFRKFQNEENITRKALGDELIREKISPNQQRLHTSSYFLKGIDQVTHFSGKEHRPLTLALRELGVWWSDFSRRTADLLESDCTHKGHHLVLRYHIAVCYGTCKEKHKGQTHYKLLAPFLDQKYEENCPTWFAWGDHERDSKIQNKKKRKWNLPQLFQLLVRQDRITDKWFKNRGGRENPNHPLAPRAAYYSLSRNRTNTQRITETRLLWLLIRDELNSPFLTNDNKGIVEESIPFPDEQFARVILDYERQLIAHYPPLTKAARIEEVRRRLESKLNIRLEPVEI